MSEPQTDRKIIETLAAQYDQAWPTKSHAAYEVACHILGGQHIDILVLLRETSNTLRDYIYKLERTGGHRLHYGKDLLSRIDTKLHRWEQAGAVWPKWERATGPKGERSEVPAAGGTEPREARDGERSEAGAPKSKEEPPSTISPTDPEEP